MGAGQTGPTTQPNRQAGAAHPQLVIAPSNLQEPIVWEDDSLFERNEDLLLLDDILLQTF